MPAGISDSSEKFIHLPYKEEVKLFTCIRDGDIKALYEKIKLLECIPVGRVSQNDIKQYRYIGICFITLAVRYAVSGGMSEKEAYSFSDVFIEKIDALDSPEKITKLIALSAIKLTNSVNESRKNAVYSPHIRKCIRYVEENICEKITVNKLARVCGLSCDYLSAAFKKEYGENLSGYILTKKLEAAQTMLADGASQKDVCRTLSFSSQSYFINVFRKKYGITPGEFKREANKYGKSEN